jgi:hypothetical protein
MLSTTSDTAATSCSPAMTERAAVLIATILCVFCAATATVGALPAHVRAHTAIRPGSTTARKADGEPPTGEHVFSVYPGPVSLVMLKAVEVWWNRSGANVALTIAASPQTANVVIKSYRFLGGSKGGGTETGVTEMPCTAPCRPDAPETITLSTDDPSPDFTLAHELGHAMGLAHTHVDTCSIMAPILAEHCPSLSLPAQIPTPDRDELVSIWGPSPNASKRLRRDDLQRNRTSGV